MPGHLITQIVIFEKMSAAHLQCAPGSLFGWSRVPRTIPRTLKNHGIPKLERCCFDLGIFNSLALAWNGIVQMDSSDNVTLCWLPGLGIILNMSWLLKSHMAHARFVKFLNVHRWSIHLAYHTMTQETSIFSQSCWQTIILMLFSLLVSTQSATSSGHTLCAMSIAFGSLMNCISCCWI
jgi:hypothetical protein